MWACASRSGALWDHCQGTSKKPLGSLRLPNAVGNRQEALTPSKASRASRTVSSSLIKGALGGFVPDGTGWGGSGPPLSLRAT